MQRAAGCLSIVAHGLTQDDRGAYVSMRNTAAPWRAISSTAREAARASVSSRFTLTRWAGYPTRPRSKLQPTAASRWREVALTLLKPQASPDHAPATCETTHQRRHCPGRQCALQVDLAAVSGTARGLTGGQTGRWWARCAAKTAQRANHPRTSAGKLGRCLVRCTERCVTVH